MNDTSETIAAVGTAPGRSAVGVVRVSGPRVPGLIDAITGRRLAARCAELVVFRASDGSAIDQGLALYFPRPASYTGEDVLELQGHGGPVVQRLLLQRCLELGARLAEPGEFTRRAFLNGKLDLAQAEGVADLIDASTAAAARSAMRSLSGAFSLQVRALEGQLIDLRVLVEGALDFPEEEIDFLGRVDAQGRLRQIGAQLEAVLTASRRGSLLREGARIVLIGQPNVGKSSLLNQLAGDELAIVTEIPGTTRDTIRLAIDLGGMPAYIIDTAGLRESADPVERLGIARTWQAIQHADLALVLVDARSGMLPGDQAIVARLPARLPHVLVHNKIDLAPTAVAVDRSGSEIHVWLSAKSGAGIDELRTVLCEVIGWEGAEEGVFLARERHLHALAEAQKHWAAAVERIDDLELLAEELRLSQQALGSITGEFTADDLLGEIFSRFCIGK